MTLEQHVSSILDRWPTPTQVWEAMIDLAREVDRRLDALEGRVNMLLPGKVPVHGAGEATRDRIKEAEGKLYNIRNPSPARPYRPLYADKWEDCFYQECCITELSREELMDAFLGVILMPLARQDVRCPSPMPPPTDTPH